jgi:histidine triad (HIT) family protein
MVPIAPVPTDPSCLFCAILRGDKPAAFVIGGPEPEPDADGAGSAVAAFLDVRPLFKGHTLVVPRAHHETLADLPVDQLGPLFGEARRLAAAMEDVLGAAGSFVALNNRVSQSVPHLHVHVVPRNRKDGLRGFFWPRSHYDGDEDLAAWAGRLRAGLA